MTPTNYKLFATLCEGLINEAGAGFKLVSNSPGGNNVIKYLHQTLHLAHNIEFTEIPKISWSDLKSNRRGAWIIIVGTQGTAAINASNGHYTAVASNGGEPETVDHSRGDLVMSFVKRFIGKAQSFYTANNTYYVRDQQRKRVQNKGSDNEQASKETIIKKFKPIWVKAMTAASADIKGMAQTMIKNDAYDKASHKIALLKNLENAIENIQSGERTDIPEWIVKSISVAILMAAAYYYPDKTGAIEKSRYSSTYTSERHEGPALLLQDISNGDTAKLSTILSFFKRSLISG